MTAKRAPASTAARAKLWIERDGQLVLSDYRVRLLELIAETGSLSEAAHRMGLSYRRAWGKLREIERNLGRKLVHSEVGGAGGGSSSLTPEAEDLIRRYHRLRARLDDDLSEAFAELFGHAPLG